MFGTILLFIAILGILILVHEFGHFFAAKKAGAKVEEFGFGFPPRIWGVKRGETLYSINLLPIGGFVKIYGEDGEERKDPRSFSSRSILTRSLIIVAGVVMNMLLAVVLFSAGHFVGLPQVLNEESPLAGVKNIRVRVAEVVKDSPAELAAIQVGDTIVELHFNDEKLTGVRTIASVQNFITAHHSETITLVVERAGESISKELIPRENPPEGEGAVGIAMVRTGEISYPFYLAPLKGIESTFFVTVGTLRAFGGIVADLVTTGSLRGELSGPVGIAVLTGQVQKMGFIFLLQFMALISVNLAIINALPFPALDGGRLFFLGIEKIRGKPVNQKYEKIAHTIGFALLILLMIVVTFRDIGRLI